MAVAAGSSLYEAREQVRAPQRLVVRSRAVIAQPGGFIILGLPFLLCNGGDGVGLVKTGSPVTATLSSRSLLWMTTWGWSRGAPRRLRPAGASSSQTGGCSNPAQVRAGAPHRGADVP